VIGKTLSHYQILDKIGAGGMGEVYRARDTQLDRDVALKILPDEIAGDTDRRMRFEREAKAVAALSHPGILAIYDFGSDDGQTFAAMELLEGETLADRLLAGRIPVRKARELAVLIADGLAAAHARGIIHRDLKPANIFITNDGRPKILDFGLARVEEQDSSHSQSPTVQTNPGSVMGTVGYMSPEQARGEELDARSDIFSLGAVLYEMVTGDRAFEGKSAAEVLGAILRDDPTPIRDKDPAFPERFESIILHCLEKNPAERFQSARDLGFALANSSSASVSDLPAARAGESSKRHSTMPIIALAGWLLAAAAGIGLLMQAGPSEDNVPIRLTNLTYSGRDWAPDISPSGDVVVFASDRDGTQKIWMKQVTGGGEEAMTDGPDDIPRFSPDGSQIMFVRIEGGQRNLYRISVVGGLPRKLLDDALEGDWSPDGRQVAFIRMRPVEGQNLVDIGIADIQTGVERILAQAENRSVYGVRWSPDGRLLAVCEGSLTGNTADASINMIDVATGELNVMTLTEWTGPYTALQWAPSSESFLVGQAVDFLANTTGTPAQVMEYDLVTGARNPLFWAPIRLPRGGWGFSTLAVLAGDKLVVDDDIVRLELHEVSWRKDQGEATPRTLTRGLGIDRQPAYSPTGSQVIFSSNRSGNVDLWIVDRETLAVRQVTDDPADDWDPAFTSNGDIVWSSDRAGHMEIWMANADGTRARQVTNDGIGAENPTMTSDGRWIVYASSHDQKIGVWKIRPDGSEATRLAEGALLLPEVSPDGRYALFLEVRSLNFVIRVIEIETGDVVPFEIVLPVTGRNQNVVPGRARWSPDGSSIVYVGQNEQGLTGVYAQDFEPGEDTSASRRPLAGFSTAFATESLGVSPDGKHVTISAQYNRRSLIIADGVSLKYWK